MHDSVKLEEIIKLNSKLLIPTAINHECSAAKGKMLPVLSF